MATKRLTKSQLVSALAEYSGSDRKQAAKFLEGLEAIMVQQLKSVGEFVLPKVLKLRAVKKPATKARDGKNPFTGESMRIAAKPASKKVRCRALSGLNASIS
jgi:nucleoid DNA-binding protein